MANIADYEQIYSFRPEDKLLVGVEQSTLAVTMEELEEEIKVGKVASDWGTQNSGRNLVVGDNGIVRPYGVTLYGKKTITQNGDYDPVDDYIDGYTTVVANVRVVDATLGTARITKNGRIFASDYGFNGFSMVSVSVTKPFLSNITITEDGTYYADAESDDGIDGYDVITVSVPIQSIATLIERTVSGRYVNPVVSYVKLHCFDGCTNLTEVEFAACTSIGSYAFSGCTSLSSASFSACDTIGRGAFQGCTTLSNVYIELCTSIGMQAFQNCTTLSMASFPNCERIGGYAFYGCKKLESIYLGGNSVVALTQTTNTAEQIFESTPITNSEYLNHYGSIYVPDSLFVKYLEASQWQTLSERIVGV